MSRWLKAGLAAALLVVVALDAAWAVRRLDGDPAGISVTGTIERMPPAAQYLAAVIPLTYYLRVVRGIVLKGIGFEFLWPELLPLVAFGVVVFTLAILRFRKQLE